MSLAATGEPASRPKHRAPAPTRLARWVRIARAAAVWLVLGSAFALAQTQPELVVNGRQIAGNTTSLVSGSSYAPGAALAQALGGTFVIDGSRALAVIEAGGRILQVAIFRTAAEAAADATAMRLDGIVLGGPGAIDHEGEVYLPVKQVSESFGGMVTFLDGQNTVLVVQPRARLNAVRHLQEPERLELLVSAPVRYGVFLNEPVNTLQLHLERTDVEVVLPPIEGDQFIIAAAAAAGGGTDVRIQLRQDVDYQIYKVPEGRGFRLVVAFGRPGESPLLGDALVVLDAGHGGDDPGLMAPELGSESMLTLGFANRVASRLRARGVEVHLTRDSDHQLDIERRSNLGVGADMFISLHMAELPTGEFNAYFLGEAADIRSLQMAIRQNAQGALSTATDALRRELLLGLIPDLERGRRLAEALSGRLFAAGDYRGNNIASAPLQVLGGAAGRGVLLEFSAADLVTEELAGAMAEAILALLEQEAASIR